MLSFISAALESLLEDVEIDYPVVTRRWSFAIAGKQGASSSSCFPRLGLALTSPLLPAANDTMPLHQAFEIWAWPESASKDALLPFHRKPGAGHLTRFWSPSLSSSFLAIVSTSL